MFMIFRDDLENILLCHRILLLLTCAKRFLDENIDLDDYGNIKIHEELASDIIAHLKVHRVYDWEDMISHLLLSSLVSSRA
jgi:hypothetical protein